MPSPPPLPSVLHLIAPAPQGGAESAVVALAGAWRRAGGSGGVAVILLHAEADRFVARLRDQQVTVWEVPSHARGYAAEIRAVAAALDESRPDVVHTHGYRADAVGFLAARRARLPVVSTAHGFTGGDLKNRVYEWFDRQLLTRFGAVSCVSVALERQLAQAGVRRDRLRLIPNATGAATPRSRAEARRILGLPEDGRVVGWVGRLSHEKAPLRFVDAVMRMTQPCLGVLVGDGPLRDEVSRAAASTAGRVRALGAVDGAGGLLRAFDALALSSSTEGTPMILLEAMQAEVPIVAFGVGGVPALVGDTALVIPPGDQVALVAGMDRLLAEPSAAQALARDARARLEARFGESQWVQAHRELYALAAR